MVLQLAKLLILELRVGQLCKVDWLRDGLDVGKGVCYDVVPPGNVANISRKLPDVAQVIELARGALIGLQSEGGLWSVNIVKCLPSIMSRKCLIDSKMPRSLPGIFQFPKSRN